MAIFTRKSDDAETIDAPIGVLDDISGDYAIDAAHTTVGFSARHAMVTTVHGAFKEFEGTAHIDTANPASSTVSLTIKAESIDTWNADRDGHLRSGDFLDVETYAEITFVSTRVERDGDEWSITGDLTVKGVTKSVAVPFEFGGSAQDPYGNTRIGFEGTTAINRSEWGITFNAALETGGVLVSDKVKLAFDISAIKTGQ